MPTLNICMISFSHALQDDRIYWKEALTLQQNGYQVTHIGIGHADTSTHTAEGIRLVSVAPPPPQLGHPVANRLLNALTPRNNNSIYSKLIAAAAAEQAAVYHLHDYQLHKIARRLKALPHHPRVITDIHDANGDMVRNRLHHLPLLRQPIALGYSWYVDWLEKSTIRHYDAVITAEQKVAQTFARQVAPHKIHTLYNFAFFQPDQYTTPQQHTFDFIYAGQISEERGILTIIEAAGIARQQKKDLKGLLIGHFITPALKQQALQLIQNKGLTNTITVHDPVPFETMAPFYQSARVGLCILHPTPKFLHAIPIKLFEYMAFGLPVILSEKGVAASFLTQANAGILVNPHSAEGIAAALLNILQTPGLYHQYSSNGTTAVQQQFNWKQESTKLLTIYHQLTSPITHQV